MNAAEAGYRVLCTTATDLVTTLAKALAEHRFEDRLKLLCRPKLLIIDEIGYLPLDKRDATCLFQPVSRRDERGAIILNSNKSYGDWGAIFAGDSVIASAILDRLLHHYHQHQRGELPVERQAPRWVDSAPSPAAGRRWGDGVTVPSMVTGGCVFHR